MSFERPPSEASSRFTALRSSPNWRVPCAFASWLLTFYTRLNKCSLWWQNSPWLRWPSGVSGFESWHTFENNLSLVGFLTSFSFTVLRKFSFPKSTSNLRYTYLRVRSAWPGFESPRWLMRFQNSCIYHGSHKNTKQMLLIRLVLVLCTIYRKLFLFGLLSNLIPCWRAELTGAWPPGGGELRKTEKNWNYTLRHSRRCGDFFISFRNCRRLSLFF